MTDILVKTELLDRTRAARAAWDERFAVIPGDQLATPGVAGHWPARDVLAHLTTDHRRIAGQLRALTRSEVPTARQYYGHTQTPPPGTDLSDQDQRNAWTYSIDRERPLDEVLAMIPEHADALEAALAAVPEDELPRPHTSGDNAHVAHIRPKREGESGLPLAAIIASYAHEHYAAHTADIRAAFAHGLYGHSG